MSARLTEGLITQEDYTAWEQAQTTGFVNEIKSRVEDDAANIVVQEQLSAESQARKAAVKGEEEARIVADNEEKAARIAADEAEAAAREEAISKEVADRTEAITAESKARSAADEAEEAARKAADAAEEAARAAAIAAEAAERQKEDAALSSKIADAAKSLEGLSSDLAKNSSADASLKSAVETLQATARVLESSVDALKDAEQNVQADWTETDETKDSFIKNKPSVAGSNHTHTNASQSAAGFMSAADKKKLDTILSLVYPVGSVYISSKDTDPATLFGGKWKRIKDKFIMAAGDTYKAGTTGGVASVTLTNDNLPTHSHSFTPSGTVTVAAHSHSFTPAGSVSVGAHSHSFSWSGSHSHNYRISTLMFFPNLSGNQIIGHSPAGAPVTITADRSRKFKMLDGRALDNLQHAAKGSGMDIVYSYSRYAEAMTDDTKLENFYSDNQARGVAPLPAGQGAAMTESIDSTTINVSGTTGSATPSASFSGSAGTTGGATPSASFSGAAGTTGSAGDGKAFTILPPYETKYMWERTE